MNTQRLRARLQFSLRAVLLVLTLAAVGGWWWQNPFQEETLILQPQLTNRGPRHVELTKTVSKRRHGLGNILTDGPTTIVDDQGALISEEQWRLGVRHGTYRRWDDTGQLLSECEFERGRLIRLGKTIAPDLTYSPSADEPTHSGEPSLDRNQVDDEEQVNKSRKGLFKALNGDATIDYVNQPFNEVLRDFKFTYAMPIIVDPRVCRGPMLQMPITAATHDQPVALALLDILGPLNLTLAIRHEVIWVTTANSALQDDAMAPRVQIDKASPELLDALAKPANFDYLDQPLSEVIRDLGFTYHISIEADLWKGSRPISSNLKGISLRSAIGTLLHCHNLQCEAIDDKLLITSPASKTPRLKVTVDHSK